MNLKTLIAIAALAIPTALFAASPQAPATQAPSCATKPADQKYWTKVYDEAVAHGTAALKQNNEDEVKKSNALANFAGQNACLTKPSPAHVTLNEAVQKIAMQASVKQYFDDLDAALGGNEISKDEFKKYEEAACKEALTMPVTVPKRCEQYRGK